MRSFWNSTGSLAALLSNHRSNIRAIRRDYNHTSRLRYLLRSDGKTSYWLVNIIRRWSIKRWYITPCGYLDCQYKTCSWVLSLHIPTRIITHNVKTHNATKASPNYLSLRIPPVAALTEKSHTEDTGVGVPDETNKKTPSAPRNIHLSLVNLGTKYSSQGLSIPEFCR